jgi:tRNA-2-methylthio-N6-dimethylallyladenosine synthase
MADQVPAAAADERLQRLQALLNAQQLAYNQASVGRRTSVLLERRGKRPGQLVGKSPWLQSVQLETSAAIGDLVEVDSVSAGPNSLAGTQLLPGEGRSPAERDEPEPGLGRGARGEAVAA